MDKLIITAAITGSRMTRDVAPYIPITPDEIAQSAIECWDAGAAIVHIHVRDPKTGLGTQDLNLFRQVVEPLRERTDLLLCLTTSGIPGCNLAIEERLEVAAKSMKEKGVKPELEIFDVGMMVTCLRMRDQGYLEEPLHFQFVLGTPWGSPATPKSFLHLYEHLPEDATWSIIGIGKGHLPMAMMGLILGGHIRVGMEDNIYYERGVLAKSNAEFVERIVRIAKEYGRETATPREAREILGLRKK